MAHKGAECHNLFINGTPSPDRHPSTGRVIHQRRSLTQTRWMDFAALTWMLGHSKLAEEASVWVASGIPPPPHLGTSTFVVPSTSKVCWVYFSFPPAATAPCLVCLRYKRHFMPVPLRLGTKSPHAWIARVYFSKLLSSGVTPLRKEIAYIVKKMLFFFCHPSS